MQRKKSDPIPLALSFFFEDQFAFLAIILILSATTIFASLD
jgi:hypothetical protein